MCWYWVTVKYNCGHEARMQHREKGQFCLFGDDSRICNAELGSHRVLDVIDTEWCPQCQGAFGPNEQAMVPPAELATQEQHRQQFQKAAAPMSTPDDNRKKVLSSFTHRNLLKMLKDEAIFTAENFMLLVRYIVALPWWIDRKALVEELSPWFAQLLDEEKQLSLRPNLRSVGCEYTLDNVMVWRRDLGIPNNPNPFMVPQGA
ncbi:hypothetical protein F5Y04DRAFT_284776 [Hypomontagnella monticulosa]|nr:hypothetical protein F5Y04DRAFT_284776 [Hypomontagnella monticulosa]